MSETQRPCSVWVIPTQTWFLSLLCHSTISPGLSRDSRYKSTVWTTTHIVNINIFWPWDSATTRAPQVKWIIINDWKLALHPCKNALPPKSLLAKKFNWVNSSLIAPCFSLAMCQLTVQYTVLCNKKIISNRPMFQREGSDLIKKPRYLETFLH